MKKLLQIPLLLVALVLSSIPISAHDFEVDGIYYRFLDKENNTVSVTYKGELYSSYIEYEGDIDIPDSVTYNGKVFALPFNQTYYGLYANCDLIGQYYDNVDKLLSEDFDLNRYIEIIKKTTNINSDSKTFGLLSTSDLINWLPSTLDESGNTKHFLWNDKEKIIDFTAPFALEAFEIASDLYKYSWSSTDDYISDPTQLFINGKIAFSTSPSNYLTLYTNNVKFSSFPGGKIISVPHYLEISSDTQHPNEAFAVAKFLSYSVEGYHARMDVFEEEKGSSIMNFMPVITEDSVVSRWFSYSINKPYEKVFNEVIDGSVTVLLEPNLYVPSYQDARFYLNTGLYYDDIHGGADLKIGDFIWEVSIGNISVSDYAKYMTKELCAVLNKPIKDGYNSLYLSLN